jgi:hypothetical protein
MSPECQPGLREQRLIGIVEQPADKETVRYKNF